MNEELSPTEAPLPLEAPFRSEAMDIAPEWIDYNCHLNMAYYLVLFDRGVDQLWEKIGLGPRYRAERGFTTYTAEAHIRYLREVRPSDRVIVTLQIVDHDEKRLHLWQEMHHADEGWCAATCETLALHVDQSGPKVAPMPEDIRTRVAAVAAAHAALPRPEALGRPMGIRRKPR